MHTFWLVLKACGNMALAGIIMTASSCTWIEVNLGDDLKLPVQPVQDATLQER